MQPHPRWSAWWPFALLCLLAATRWALNATLPTSGTTLLSASTGCAAAALVAFIFQRAIRGSDGHPINPRTLLGGALLLAGPFFSLLLTGHGISPNSLTLALALVPIVAAIAEIALGNTPPGSFAARTWPALAAITGLLLLIPQPNLSNPVTDAALLLAPLATGIGAAIFAHSNARRNPSALGSTLSAAALLFAAAWLIQFLLHHTTAHLSPLAALLDAVTALLTLFALSRIGLPRWSAQFALVPLMVILQGFVLLRPPIDAYNSAGLALLTLGCVFLLLPQPSEKPA